MEAVLLVVLGAAVFGYIVRELLSLIFWRAMLISAGFCIALFAFGLAALWIPSDFAAKIKSRRRPLNDTLQPFAFTSSERRWTSELLAMEASKPQPESVYPQSFLVSTAIDQLIEYVLRDFVLSWFNGVSPDPAFPNQVDATIRQALILLVERMRDVEWSDLLVTKMMPIITDHFRNFVAAETAVRERSMGQDLTDNKEFQFAVAGQYCHGRLHPSIALKHYRYVDYRKSWLRNHVGRFLPSLLGTSASSAVVSHLARDIISCSVLFPVLSMFSDSDFWNQMIVNTAGPTLQDRRKVEKLIQALNEHATGASSKSTGAIAKVPSLKLGPNAEQGDYERFLRGIHRCKSLPEARQTRYYISVQLQRSIKEGTNPIYISRLQHSKQAIERQINKLSGHSAGRGSVSGSPSLSRSDSSAQFSLHDPREDYTLTEILSDPACALFFMEYMDQRKRTMLVQFWLTVNSLRDPLENELDEDDDDSNHDNENNETNDMNDPLSTSTNTMINENDITQIYKTYFRGNIPYVTLEAEDAVERFVKAEVKSLDLYKKARSAILRTQTVVYKAMEARDLIKFKKSDLFLKFLASDHRISVGTAGPRAVTRSDVDSLQLDSIDYTEPSKISGEDNFKAVEAVEAAFNTIMEGGNTSGPNAGAQQKVGLLFGESDTEKEQEQDKDSDKDSDRRKKRKKSQRLFDSGSDSDSGENEDLEPGADPERSSSGELHLAAPGDLSLTEAISVLSSDIEVLYRQEAVLEPLLHKAELTNNTGNLRILRKSKASLEKEIQRKELQRQQYIVQESDNSLFGRSNIQIRSYMTSSDTSGHYMLYIIEVERLASDGSVSAGWVVARRYSQFFQLHQHLRYKFPQVRKLEFPKKGGVLKFQHRSFLENRKISLHNYLRELLKMPDVCRSKAFRVFLSSETFSVDSLGGGGGGGGGVGGGGGGGRGDSTISLAAGPATDDASSLNDTEVEEIDIRQSIMSDLDAEAELDSARPFIQPICDLFIQLFGFDRGNNWLRGRAVVVVVQQILGGTIEKKIREAVGGLATEDSMTTLIQKVTDSVWPEGKSKPPTPVRSAGEKIKCKHDAQVIVQALIRDASIKIVGGSSSRYAGAHAFEMFQNEILNAHLVYTFLDVLVEHVFD